MRASRAPGPLSSHPRPSGPLVVWFGASNAVGVRSGTSDPWPGGAWRGGAWLGELWLGLLWVVVAAVALAGVCVAGGQVIRRRRGRVRARGRCRLGEDVVDGLFRGGAPGQQVGVVLSALP